MVHFTGNYPLLVFFVGRFLPLKMMTGRRKSSTISKICTYLAHAHTLSCGFLLNLCFVDQCLTCALFPQVSCSWWSWWSQPGQKFFKQNSQIIRNVLELFARSSELVAHPVKRSHHLGQQHSGSSCHGQQKKVHNSLYGANFRSHGAGRCRGRRDS